MTGAIVHKRRNGAAAGRAPGSRAARTKAIAAAIIGLAAISTTNRRSPCPTTPAALAAVVAAVSHSSILRFVTTRRTRVTAIACAVSKAWKARKVTVRPTCASAVAMSLRRLPRKTGIDCARPGPTRRRASTGRSCDAATPMTVSVQNQRGPGSTVHPAISSASSVGATRLRRRLSRIFQRPMTGRVFRCSPWRDGTNGNSHRRICQSPRIQRCCRRAWESTLDGYSSTSSTSDTRATRA